MPQTNKSVDFLFSSLNSIFRCFKLSTFRNATALPAAPFSTNGLAGGELASPENSVVWRHHFLSCYHAFQKWRRFFAAEATGWITWSGKTACFAHGGLTAGSRRAHGGLTAGSRRAHGALTAGSRRAHGGLTAGSRRAHGGLTAGSRRAHGGLTAGSWRAYGGLTAGSRRARNTSRRP